MISDDWVLAIWLASDDPTDIKSMSDELGIDETEFQLAIDRLAKAGYILTDNFGNESDSV